MRYIVTGGCGFIGSAVIRQLSGAGHEVFNIDKMTYAANPQAIAGTRAKTVKACLTDCEALTSLFATAQPDTVIHLAAETHVDRSIDAPQAFIKTNVEGTFTLLRACLDWWNNAGKPDAFRFIHVSTDEVFGDLDITDSPFDENTAYRPSSPYSASKAASDHLARAWWKTYGLPVIVTHCSNNYGPWQHAEKLIPTVIRHAVNREPIPVYGTGENIRDWLYVDDHARGLLRANTAPAGSTLLFGAQTERRNIDLVHMICTLLDARRPASQPHARQIRLVADRPGHDWRYAINPGRTQQVIDWTPGYSLDRGLSETVDWYLQNLPKCTNNQQYQQGLSNA